MNLKLTSLTLGIILVLGGASLEAQDGKLANRWSVSGSLGLATDNMKDITNTGTWGLSTYTADFGYTGNFAGTSIPFRASFGVNMSPSGSAEKTYFDERSLSGYQVAVDLFINSGIHENVQFFIGLSLNKWSIKEKLDYINEDDEPAHFDGTHSIPGIKFGGRIGLEYKFSNALAFNALLQIAEVGHHDPVYEVPLDPKKEFGQRPMNASWFQVGVKYSF